MPWTRRRRTSGTPHSRQHPSRKAEAGGSAGRELGSPVLDPIVLVNLDDVDVQAAPDKGRWLEACGGGGGPVDQVPGGRRR